MAPPSNHRRSKMMFRWNLWILNSTTFTCCWSKWYRERFRIFIKENYFCCFHPFGGEFSTIQGNQHGRMISTTKTLFSKIFSAISAHPSSTMLLHKHNFTIQFQHSNYFLPSKYKSGPIVAALSREKNQFEPRT